MKKYFKHETELNKIIENYSKIFVLLDENSSRYCLNLINIKKKYKTILIGVGEKNKNLGRVQDIWNELLLNNADRDSLLINLGGGVITDMGAFVASTYKRGIDFINIPTTLLAQVDATIGGKSGVNFSGQKNMIGLFIKSKKVFVDTIFLKTLSEREIRNGFAEILKHGLILDKEYFYFALDEMKKIKSNRKNIDWNKIVERSRELKTKIVTDDFKENGIRKILNFGHTIGHVIESYSLKYHKKSLKHGEAVVIGMIIALNLSIKRVNINKKELTSIIDELKKNYTLKLELFDIELLMLNIKNDKKNRDNKILFVLLEEIGSATFDHKISLKEIETEIQLFFIKNSFN